MDDQHDDPHAAPRARAESSASEGASDDDALSPTSTSTSSRRDADYIPPRLRAYVGHFHSDFYVSLSFDPLLLCHLMYEGFLPIASKEGQRYILLPKLHHRRSLCLVHAPAHVPKSVKKRAKKYAIRINRDFDGVVAGCHQQHGISWLYPPIVRGFKAIFDAGAQGIELFPGAQVRLYSIEVLEVGTNSLVAGELGYSVGSVYTSLTGFSSMSGAGTVQLHALSRLLHLSGMTVWDLGMSMAYKTSLGASDEPRDAFLALLYKWRARDCVLQLSARNPQMDLAAGVHVKELFELPSTTATSSQGSEVASSHARGKVR